MFDKIYEVSFGNSELSIQTRLYYTFVKAQFSLYYDNVRDNF